MDTYDEIKNRCESIVCNCVEGVEFMTRAQLAEAVLKDVFHIRKAIEEINDLDRDKALAYLKKLLYHINTEPMMDGKHRYHMRASAWPLITEIKVWMYEQYEQEKDGECTGKG